MHESTRKMLDIALICVNAAVIVLTIILAIREED